MAIDNKKCLGCGKVKMLHEFYFRTESLKPRCIECYTRQIRRDKINIIKSIKCSSKNINNFQKKILGVIANVYGLQVKHMFINRTIRPLPEMRYISFYFLKEKMIYKDISKMYGLKSHTSVALGLQKLEELLEYNKEIKELFRIIKNKLA